MKKIILFVLSFLFVTSLYAENEFDYHAIDNSESFFQFLQSHDYIKAWSQMTEKSHDTIVSDVYDAIKKKSAEPISKENISDDFKQCGGICQEYWKGFLSYFNPAEVLDNSTWSTGNSEKNYCEILLKHKNSETPAIIKMYKENGMWKIGLTESFWLRKLFM